MLEPLIPPINQWRHLPYPLEPVSPHSTSRLARQADTGLAHHRVLISRSPSPPAARTRRRLLRPRCWAAVNTWEAANQRKIDAVQRLAPLADTLDDLEARIDELLARTKDLGF